jgi:hypothetical protein
MRDSYADCKAVEPGPGPTGQDSPGSHDVRSPGQPCVSMNCSGAYAGAVASILSDKTLSGTIAGRFTARQWASRFPRTARSEPMEPT